MTKRITAQEVATLLNNFNSEDNFTRNILSLAKNNRIIIVSAQGDDTILFNGALTDEFELFKGGNIFMAKEGNEYLGYLKQSSDCSRKKIEVFWNKNGLFKWKFLTLIKHFTYDLKRDGRSFCKGIVFSLDDI